MLSDVSPFYQYSLKENKLKVNITFNSPEAVILAGTGADLTKAIDYTYSAKDLRMEYDIIIEPSMSLDVKRQYDFGVVVPFKRYIKYRFEEIDKSDSVINLKINAPYLYRLFLHCLLYTSPSPRDATLSRMPSSA